MRQKIIFVVATFILFQAGICGAQDPIIPDFEDDQPSGSTADYLSDAQSSKEEMISMMQAIENAAQTQSYFVKANGTGLSVNGQTYKFSLANQYYLFYKSKLMIDDVFQDAASLGLSVIRTWGFCDGMYKEGVSFQPSPGIYDESGFLKMDYILYKASLSNMRVIIPFVNNWNDFGGIDQYVNWYLGRAPSTSEHDLFFTNETIKGWYRNYVSYFLNRVNTYTGIAYKNDPTVLAWDLANEPRAYTDTAGLVLDPWIDEMAAYIKSVDPNHLLSTGVEGWYGYTDTGVDFIRSQSSPNIDIATFHLFPDYYGLTSAQALQWIQDRANDATNALNKPVYIGEFGKMVDRSASDASTQMRTRDSLYKNIYSTASSAGVDGLGFWLLSGRQDNGTLYPDYDRFTVYYPEDSSTDRVIKSGSSLFVTASGGKGGKKSSTQSMTSIESEKITQAQLMMRRNILSGKHWLSSYNQTSFIPRGFDTDLFAE